jgi:TatA/E family protein of Tat protein translocase
VFNVGPLELMVILVLALIVFGPEKLPELMAGAGRAIREFQRASSELTDVFQDAQREFRSAVDLDEAVAAEPGTAPDASSAGAPAAVIATDPVAGASPATTASAEMETAAAMVEPAARWPDSPSAAPPPVAIAATAPPSELSETAAGLADAPPVPITVEAPPAPGTIETAATGSDAAEAEPAARRRRARQPVSPP